MNKNLENILSSAEAENIASLVNTLRSLIGLSFSSFRSTGHLSSQDLKLLRSAKENTIENELFSTNSLCKFFILADSVQNNDFNSQTLQEFAQHVKDVCKHELAKRSFIL